MAPDAAEFLNEELRFLKRNTDGGEDDSEVRRVVAQNLRLTRDLRGKLRVGKTGAGEDRQLLAADKRVQAVDRGNAGLDKFVRVIACGGVHRKTVDVLHLGGQNLRAAVLRWPMPSKTRPSISSDTASSSGWPRKRILLSFRLMPAEFSNSCTTAVSPLHSRTLQCRTSAVRQLQLGQLVAGNAPRRFDDHQRPGDSRMVRYSRIIQPQPFATSSICCSISDTIFA